MQDIHQTIGTTAPSAGSRPGMRVYCLMNRRVTIVFNLHDLKCLKNDPSLLIHLQISKLMLRTRKRITLALRIHCEAELRLQPRPSKPSGHFHLSAVEVSTCWSDSVFSPLLLRSHLFQWVYKRLCLACLFRGNLFSAAQQLVRFLLLFSGCLEFLPHQFSSPVIFSQRAFS